MPTLKQTDVFSAWLRALKDARAKTKILVRLRRLAGGNPGDVKPIGGGLIEMRVSEGPGYRVYYGTHGEELILILAGGTKGTQDKDIKRAHELWDAFKASDNDEESEED